VIEPGTKAPEFTLPNHRGEDVSRSDFEGRKLLLCFYPNDFSPVCSDQLSIYQEVLGEIRAKGVELVGISTDGTWSHNAFRKQLGLEMTLLADFHPKGEVAKAYGVWSEEHGVAGRALVMVAPDGVVQWSYLSPPLEVPGANLIFDALEQRTPA
jgi:peroxiredoxin